jgi:hypothetical protein
MGVTGIMGGRKSHNAQNSPSAQNSRNSQNSQDGRPKLASPRRKQRAYFFSGDDGAPQKSNGFHESPVSSRNLRF